MDSMMMESDNYPHYSAHQPFQQNYQYPFQNQVPAQLQVETDDDLWEPPQYSPTTSTSSDNSEEKYPNKNYGALDAEWEEEQPIVQPQPQNQSPFTFGFSGQNDQPSAFSTNWAGALEEEEEIEPDYRDHSRSYIQPVRGAQHKHHKINKVSNGFREQEQTTNFGVLGRMENGRVFRKRDITGDLKNDWDDWMDSHQEKQDIEAVENVFRRTKVSRLEI